MFAIKLSIEKQIKKKLGGWIFCFYPYIIQCVFLAYFDQKKDTLKQKSRVSQIDIN